MKKHIPMLVFFSMLLIMFFVMSAIMSDGGAAAALQGFANWYEIYLYLFVSIFLIVSGEEKAASSIAKKSIRELAGIIVSAALLYLIDRNPLWPEPDSALYLLVILFKLLLSIAATHLVMKLIALVSNNKDRLGEAFEKQKYTIAVSAIFLIRFAGDANKEPNSWPSIWYLMDYSDGFGSRFLPGQILSLIRRRGFVSSTGIVVFVATALSVLIVLCALLLNAFMHSLKKEYSLAGLFLLALYIAMPANIEALWAYYNIGLTESFVLVFLLLAVLLFELIRKPLPKYCVAAVLSFVCMACYQGYFFLYFPIMFCMLANEYFEKKERPQLIGGIFVCLCTVTSFVLFQFFHYINYESVDVLAEELSTRTDMDVMPMVLDLEFNRPISYHWHLFFEGNITRDSQ